MKYIRLTMFAVLVFFGFQAVQPASALPEFKKAFLAKYGDKEKNPEFYTVLRKANCDVCHVKGEKDKHKKNEYGKALDKLIKGDAKHRMDDAKKEAAKESEEKALAAKKAVQATILKELEVAFKKVAEMKGKDGTKFGDNLKEGKLPTPILTKEENDKAKKEDGHHDDDHDHDGDHDKDHDKKEGHDKDE